MPPASCAYQPATPAATPTTATAPSVSASSAPLAKMASLPIAPATIKTNLPQTPIRVQAPGQSPAQKIITSSVITKPSSPMAPRVATNVIRIRSPIVTSVPATTEQSPPVNTANTGIPAAMLQTLAAAAASSPKISMNSVPVLQQGAANTIRMKGMQPGQQIRFAAPGATVLRAASPQQSKQIILQKPGQNIAGQPQIVHLLKAGQGMVTMPKVSIIPGKTVQTTGAKPLNQGPTILRLVNPNTVAGSKILTTMKTSGIVAMSKGQNIAGKQTIMITKPGGNGGLVGRTNQIIVVTTGSGLRAVQAVTTSQAGAGQGGALTTPVNVLPLSAANHVTNQQGVKMIVVSSGAMGGGTTGKPITITVPGQGGIPKTVTIAAKGSQQAIFNPNKSQTVTVPQIQKNAVSILFLVIEPDIIFT